MNTLQKIKIFLTVSVFVCLSCLQQPLEPDVRLESITRIDLQQAEFISDKGVVRLSWVKPSSYDVAYYRIYRTAQYDLQGMPINIKSEGPREFVDKNLTSYEDVIGMANGDYSYWIAPVVNSRNSHNPIEGPLSLEKKLRAGSSLSFNINDGAIFIVKDTCQLNVFDYNGIISSVRFTDSVDGQKPLFYGKSPLAEDINGNKKNYTWVLPKGPGLKVVYAEVTFTDNNIDTLSDDIKIAPYKVLFKLRNEEVDGNRSMRVLEYPQEYLASKLWKQHILYKPKVEFSFSIFNDSSFADEFEYQISLAKNGSKFPIPVGADNTIFLPFKKGMLKGVGPFHDDMAIYDYTFDVKNALINPESQDASNLEYIYNNSMKAIDSSSRIGFAAIFDSIKALTNTDRKLGKKEFALVVRFKGRYFGEDRIVNTSPRDNNAEASFCSYFDFYPPAMNRHDFDFLEHLVVEDSTFVEGSFNIRIGNCTDFGGANIKDIEMVIASMPDSLIGRPPPTFTEEKLKSFRHKIFKFPVAGVDTIISPVYWERVNVSDWTAGWYYLGYVTEDEYGNRGLPGIKAGEFAKTRNSMPNPYRVFLTTGKREL